MAMRANEAGKPAAAKPKRGRGWHALANPARFMRLAKAVFPWAAAVAGLCLVAGLVLGLGVVPADYQQGDAYRIMFVHVPSASLAMIIYAIIALSGAAALIWRHPLADLIGRASAPVGAAFTFINLLTGSLWGQPMWGTWWVWDARLTSMLILFFLYLGYIALNSAFEDPTKGARAAAILALVGVINLPIIHFSVDWWNTLHQPATIMKLDRPSIDPSMMAPLILMFVGFLAYYLMILALRMRSEIVARRIRNLRLAQVAQ
jgi:heme exporter protein C